MKISTLRKAVARVFSGSEPDRQLARSVDLTAATDALAWLFLRASGPEEGPISLQFLSVSFGLRKFRQERQERQERQALNNTYTEALLMPCFKIDGSGGSVRF